MLSCCGDIHINEVDDHHQTKPDLFSIINQWMHNLLWPMLQDSDALHFLQSNRRYYQMIKHYRLKERMSCERLLEYREACPLVNELIVKNWNDLRDIRIREARPMDIFAILNDESNQDILLPNSIQTLHVSLSIKMNRGIGEITSALQSNKDIFLKSLFLQYNGISPSGATFLSKLLEHNATITFLDVEGNHLNSKGGEILACALLTNKTLITLNIPDNGLSIKGAVSFAKMLTVNSTLRNLDLSGNHLGNQGATIISQSLLDNSTLEELQLRSNRLTSIDMFAPVLYCRCTALQTLGVANNNISSDNIKQFVDGLKHNNVLRKIDFLNNRIDDTGADLFINVLQYNTTLIKLNFKYNSLGDYHLARINDCLEVNETRLKIRDLFFLTNEQSVNV